MMILKPLLIPLPESPGEEYKHREKFEPTEKHQECRKPFGGIGQVVP